MIQKVGPGEINFAGRRDKRDFGSIKTAQNPARYMSANSVMDYLSFRGQSLLSSAITPSADDFAKTVQFNYFKLPKIKLTTGETYQAQPDKTQLESAKNIYEGNNTLTVAPTGTGKTAIANYAITKNLYDNKRTFYTTPLKALSNDKYREFSAIYGKDNVGLMTGDIKLKAWAPIVIMTTEIYRNMTLGAYASGDTSKFDNVGTVVFDEAHYLGDSDRGKVWEESLMLTPKDVQILALSATVGNPESLTEWVGKIQPSKKSALVEANPEDRHVPLIYYNYTGKEGKEFAELIRGDVNIPALKEDENPPQRQLRAIDELYKIKHEKEDNYAPNDEDRKEIINELNWLVDKRAQPNFKFTKTIQQYYRLKEIKAKELTQLLLDAQTKSVNVSASRSFDIKGSDNPVDFTDLTYSLKDGDKLPAIIFVFSREKCDDAAKLLSKKHLDLTTDEEKAKIEKVIQSYEEQGIYLGRDFNRKLLLEGVAPHHAGLLPSYKKLVEDLFKQKLVKVVVATSTLSAGINMPAKTTVITNISKPTSASKTPDDGETTQSAILTANEFHQMTGRAGRRGIDNIGNVVLYNLSDDQRDVAESLILSKADPLKSEFKADYGFLSAYYQRFNDDKLLDFFENNTLRIHQAGANSEAELVNLKKEFEDHKNVMIEEGFLEKEGETFNVTPKGKLLGFAHGYNELTFVNMLYDKKLEGLNPQELAYFAGAVSGSGEYQTAQIDEKNLTALKNACASSEDSKVREILHTAREYDDRLLETELENDILSNSNSTDSFIGYLGYRWTELNSRETTQNSVENFMRLTDKNAGITTLLSGSLEDGMVYRNIAQTIDVLKQIEAICEFALENEEYEADKDYYKELLKTAKESIELMSKPPIFDAVSIA